MAKAAFWSTTDAEVRKLGEQTGLDTPVVLAVNDGTSLRTPCVFSGEVKMISAPSGEYGRKAETQRN